MNKILAALTLGAAAIFAANAGAAEIEVKMLNKGAKGVMVFEPDFIKAAPGDTIKFVPTDKGHNAEIIKGMLPDGAEAFKGKTNEEVTVTLTKEGLYGVKCLPHYGMGMVALIQVGAPTNLDAAKAVKHPGKAKIHFEALLGQVAN
ncbi:pseudoazurin [Brucella endophytica]|uniref:Pseudoazurin n=1 Tax=Brucella endophytica TaxID=1963359 RepID=A0A916SKZ6_9HYPH|nr:pseudoazurin [Brucella endophytica]GGB02651.1 pseudoazurin [Brucella endophytica]